MNYKNNKITKVTTSWQDGYMITSIYGLNIFGINHVDLEPDPRVLLFHYLAALPNTLTHIDIHVLDIDEINSIFKKNRNDSSILYTNIGIYNAHFYEDNNKNGILINKFTPWILQDQSSLIEIIKEGAIALYIQCPEYYILTNIINNEFTHESKWIQQMSKIFGMIVYPGHDGQYINISTKSDYNLRIIYDILDIITHKIERCDWYQIHQDKLHWDNDGEECLILRKSRNNPISE